MEVSLTNEKRTQYALTHGSSAIAAEESAICSR